MATYKDILLRLSTGKTEKRKPIKAKSKQRTNNMSEQNKKEERACALCLSEELGFPIDGTVTYDGNHLDHFICESCAQKKNHTTTSSKKLEPKKYSIIKYETFYYFCTDFYHERAQRKGIRQGETIEAGGVWGIGYDINAPNYIYAHAVFKYQNKWYFIPSMFSEEGTIDPSNDWTYEELHIPYQITHLDEEICKKMCPGYLDK